jgi:hypothetical protein
MVVLYGNFEYRLRNVIGFSALNSFGPPSILLSFCVLSSSSRSNWELPLTMLQSFHQVSRDLTEVKPQNEHFMMIGYNSVKIWQQQILETGYLNQSNHTFRDSIFCFPVTRLKYREPNFTRCFVWVRNLVSHIKRRT